MTAVVHTLRPETESPSAVAIRAIEKSTREAILLTQEINQAQSRLAKVSSSAVLGRYLDIVGSEAEHENFESIVSEITRISDFMASQSVLAEAGVKDLLAAIKHQEKIVMKSIRELTDAVASSQK